MARLNEPPAAPAVSATVLAGGAGGVENVDALKRRFVRQNRELAKNNSTQSLRIRSLEIEVSRLLQTNLELREELLRARNAEQDARRQSNREGVRGFKEEMMAKLRELSGIVEGIEEAKEEKADDTFVQEERRMSVLSQMEFRERQPLADLMRECQMPTIDEDKTLLSRRSLEPAEIKTIRLSDGSSNGSPDLGPPPVARFECQDPIKFDTQNVPEPQNTEAEAETNLEPEHSPQEEDLPASMFANLETRRKRKDSQPRLELRRSSILPPPSPSGSDAEITAPTLRTGAKRKLADRDLDKQIKAPSKTDFTFNRKTSVEPSKSTEGVEAEKKPETVEIQAPAPPSARKVLGDKSVNMSPRKTVADSDKLVKDDAKKPAQPKFGAAKDRTTSRRSRLSVVPPPQAEPEVSVSTIELPTVSQDPVDVTEPALHNQGPADIFSPTPEPSSVSNERAATPPPMALSKASVEAARPSRRARPTVNYAEPSLGAKMRRQEKGMMDAVTGLQHHRLAMSVSAEKKARTKVVVKDEPQDEDSWKNLPTTDEAAKARVASPLGLKGNGSTNMDAIIKPERNDSPPSNDTTSTFQAPPSAPTQPPPRQRVRSSAQPKPSQLPAEETDLDDATRRLKELDMYDFKDSSSPASTSSTSAPSDQNPAPAAKPRTHRRHSSIPKDTLRTTSDGSERPRAASRTATGGAAASRRRSMMT